MDTKEELKDKVISKVCSWVCKLQPIPEYIEDCCHNCIVKREISNLFKESK